jgi:hypothetical protein
MSKALEENVYGLIEALKPFEYTIESVDHRWDVMMI